jgi:predicted ABC-type ATPase
LLRDLLQVTEFVNADVIAEGLSAFAPERAAVAAGRIMLSRAKELATRRVSFALETTMASRSLAPWIASLIRIGYAFHAVFLWLPCADLAVARVRARVRLGGHDVPEDTVRRRYDAGLRNFFRLYRPLASSWRVLDNSGLMTVATLASGREAHLETCSDRPLWTRPGKEYGG